MRVWNDFKKWLDWELTVFGYRLLLLQVVAISSGVALVIYIIYTLATFPQLKLERRMYECRAQQTLLLAINSDSSTLNEIRIVAAAQCEEFELIKRLAK